MADNSGNILNQLQQYGIQPPAGAFKKAWDSIVIENAVPADETKIFSQLQQYSMQAPELDFKKIIAADKKRPLIISMPMRRAAAVLLFIGAGTVIYLTTFKKKETGPAYATQGNSNSNPAANNTDSNIAVIEAVKEKAKNIAAVANKKAIAAAAKKEAAKIKNEKARYIAKTKWQLADNDVFFTLVNYKETGKDKLFYKILSEKKITLNQYSYINISDKMADMLQEIYVTKKNGKPARKAKKAKKKFEKWRKKDEKYFDKALDKNPTDIIDLSDFLMHN